MRTTLPFVVEVAGNHVKIMINDEVVESFWLFFVFENKQFGSMIYSIFEVIDCAVLREFDKFVKFNDGLWFLVIENYEF